MEDRFCKCYSTWRRLVNLLNWLSDPNKKAEVPDEIKGEIFEKEEMLIPGTRADGIRTKEDTEQNIKAPASDQPKTATSRPYRKPTGPTRRFQDRRSMLRKRPNLALATSISGRKPQKVWSNTTLLEEEAAPAEYQQFDEMGQKIHGKAKPKEQGMRKKTNEELRWATIESDIFTDLTSTSDSMGLLEWNEPSVDKSMQISTGVLEAPLKQEQGLSTSLECKFSLEARTVTADSRPDSRLESESGILTVEGQPLRNVYEARKQDMTDSMLGCVQLSAITSTVGRSLYSELPSLQSSAAVLFI
ncbi:unnamed protein product [Protopolystoma xenopodis]|uniref:Uncharacterized protein n=1 Tax=Protopolystoma xenopodis TaxID=117903 RepID=A0A3S4ZEZ1_9PLAT|nr:unnamed protein product [Protopolystoma xenopodis]